VEVWVLPALQLLYRFRLDGHDRVKVNNPPSPTDRGPLPTDHHSGVIAVLKGGEVCPMPVGPMPVGLMPDSTSCYARKAIPELILLATIGKSRKQVKFCNPPRLPSLRPSKKTIPSYAFIAVNITLPT
jgi:hypothetical protein